MKKRIFTIALIVICLAVFATGTLAYFTSEATAHNVITSGYVDIELVEKHIDGSGAEVDFPEDGIEGVMPGMSVSQIVSVKNTGAEAWIRVSVAKAITAADGSKLSADVISYQVDEAKWLEKDGYYYYRTPVAPGESTEALFEEILFSGEMDNTYQNCKTEITIAAEAVQAANNGTTVEEAAGWTEELPLA